MRTKTVLLTIAILTLSAAAIAQSAHKNTTRAMRIYATNSKADDISVIDIATKKVIADIKVGTAVHGVCAQADGRRLFTTIESENSLKMIDTATNEVIAVIALTGTPNQCAVTPDGRYVAAPINHENGVDIIDVAQKKVVKVLPIKKPHNCVNRGDNDEIFCSSIGEKEIKRIDLKTMEFSAEIPVGGVPRPFDVSRDGKTTYVALSYLHGFAIASIPDQKVVERVELPPAPPNACKTEPDDTMTHGLALSPNGKDLWVTSIADNGVYDYDLIARKTSKEVPTGDCPNWISISPDGRYVTVSNSGSDSISIIDSAKQREIARIAVGKEPKRLLVVNVPLA
jgi:YVTN family beta-propeller protein